MSLNMLRGTGEAWFIPTLADGVADGGPTAAELAAGIPLGAGLSGLDGLARQKNPINQGVMRHRTELQIAGPEQFQAVTLTVVEEDGTSATSEATEREAILTTLVEGASGWIVFSRYTQTPTTGDVMHFIAVDVDDQEPNWDMGATAMTTNINVTPSTPLLKGTLQA